MLCIWFLGNTECQNLVRFLASSAFDVINTRFYVTLLMYLWVRGFENAALSSVISSQIFMMNHVFAITYIRVQLGRDKKYMTQLGEWEAPARTELERAIHSSELSFFLKRSNFSRPSRWGTYAHHERRGTELVCAQFPPSFPTNCSSWRKEVSLFDYHF